MPGLSSGNWRTDYSKLGREASRKNLNSKSRYSIQTSREYRNLTEADVELRRKYGLSLIANYTNTEKKLIRMDKKITNQTLTSLNEVYYVYMSGKAYGKLAINVQRTYRGTTITFILMKKEFKK